MTGYDPRFKNFYENPAIQSLAAAPRWTISDKDKRPVHMGLLWYQWRTDHGATPTDPTSMTTLQDMVYKFPQAATNTFFLKSDIDDVIVLDIEKTCPPDIKEKFLNTNYIYGEVSASGQGFHLIYKKPDWLNEPTFEHIKNKTVVKPSNKYFEIMFEHWIMFTRNVLPDANPNPDPLRPLIEQTLLESKKAVKLPPTQVSEPEEEIPHLDQILSILSRCSFPKEPSDFSDDLSRYELGAANFYHGKLKTLLSTDAAKRWNHDFTFDEKAWIVYEVLTAYLDERPKHSSMRDNMPWLLYLSTRSLIYQQSQKPQQKSKRKDTDSCHSSSSSMLQLSS